MGRWAIYLWPLGPTGRVTSDTLFGALCWGCRALHGSAGLERLLGGLPDSPPFVVSSAFPVFRGREGPIRCYPMPFLAEPDRARVRALALQRASPGDRHAEKRTEAEVADGLRDVARSPFVSEAVFRDVVSGIGIEGLWRRETREGPTGDLRRVGPVLLARAEADGLPDRLRDGLPWEDLDIPRNHVDRVAGATVEGLLFSIPARYWREGVGLWFVLQAEALEPLIPILSYLGDTGIGGKRTSGLSQFRIPPAEMHPVDIPAAPSPDRFVALSRYIPRAGEIEARDPRAAYRVLALHPKHEAREAGAGHRVFKGRIWILEEGAVLPFTGAPRDYYGRVVQVGASEEGPDAFPVWHSGTAIPAFIAPEVGHA